MAFCWGFFKEEATGKGEGGGERNPTSNLTDSNPTFQIKLLEGCHCQEGFEIRCEMPGRHNWCGDVVSGVK